MGFEVYHDKTDLDELFTLDFDEIAEDALIEAAPVLQASMKKAIKTSIKHDGDSELANSIKANKPKKAKNGAWITNVTPKGYSKNKVFHANGRKTKRSYPVSNALKAIWKEYGIAGRQAASPFLAKATNDASARVVEILQNTFDKKVGD